MCCVVADLALRVKCQRNVGRTTEAQDEEGEEGEEDADDMMDDDLVSAQR